jgi:hypothetical protein
MSTLTEQKQTKEKKIEQTRETVRKFEQTGAEAKRVADKVGAIKSELTDVNTAIRAARGKVLDSVQRAGDSDRKVSEARESEMSEHKKKVAGMRERTRIEEKKAEAVKPSDRRMMGGAEIAKSLGEAGKQLERIVQQEGMTAEQARKQRTAIDAAIKSSVSRNRR